MREIALLIFLTLCLQSYSNEIDSLIIRFASWNHYDSPHRIGCTNFEYDVPYKEYSITNEADIKNITACIQRTPIIKDLDFSVGCKILFVKKDSVIRIGALNDSYILIDGKTHSNTKEVIQLVNKLINTTHPNIEMFRYQPDYFGNEYINGRDELQKKSQNSSGNNYHARS